MYPSLLIVGAGIYSAVATEIALEMGVFRDIGYLDDSRTVSCLGTPVAGRTGDYPRLRDSYSHIIVAIGDASARERLTDCIVSRSGYQLATLISPRAYIAPSATVEPGCIIEPTAAVQSLAVLRAGTIVSAGAVINHGAVCMPYTHIDCHATVMGEATVPEKTKIPAGTVYRKTV